MAERSRVENQRIQLDYAQLKDTDYYRCILVYKGGRPPTMQNCKFDSCEFAFENEASNTLEFIKALAHGDPTGREFVLRGLLGLAEDG